MILIEDSTALALRPYLPDDKSMGGWVRTVRSLMRSGAFRALMASHNGDLSAALAWLNTACQHLPIDSKSIERFTVLRPDVVTGKPKRTTVSLDPELWGALCRKIGSNDAAARWIRTTAATTTPVAGSFSRALQAAIVRFVSSPTPDESHAPDSSTTHHPA